MIDEHAVRAKKEILRDWEVYLKDIKQYLTIHFYSSLKYPRLSSLEILNALMMQLCDILLFEENLIFLEIN